MSWRQTFPSQMLSKGISVCVAVLCGLTNGDGQFEEELVRRNQHLRCWFQGANWCLRSEITTEFPIGRGASSEIL